MAEKHRSFSQIAASTVAEAEDLMEPTWSETEWAWDPVALTAATTVVARNSLGAVSKPGAHSSKQSSSRPVHRPKCQVAACTSDLSQSRAYYRRYRICEEHFRQPSMILNNQVVRFCQQCAKFEPLCEFEGNKRSCRRQLSRHNERRKGRKQRAKTEGCTAADSDGENSDDSCTAQRTHSKPADQGFVKACSSTYPSRSAEAVAAAAAAAGMMLGVGRSSTLPLTPFQQQLLAQDLKEMATGNSSSDSLQPMSPPAEGIAAQTAAAAAAIADVAPTPTSAGITPQQQQQQQEVSPVPSVSDVTVQVGQPAGDMSTSGQQEFDAVLVAAARELLATWQSEDISKIDAGVGAMQCELPALSQLEAAGSSRPASNDRPPQHLPACRHAAPGQEPGSADSSVHGPAVPHTPVMDADDPHLSRVLGLLSQNQYFDPIRTDQGPVVQAATTSHALPHPFAVAVPRKPGQPSPFAASSLGTSPPQATDALLSHFNRHEHGRICSLGVEQHGMMGDMLPASVSSQALETGSTAGLLPWTKHTVQNMQNSMYDSRFGGPGTADPPSSPAGADLLDMVPPHWQMPPRSVYPDMATQHGGLGSAARPAVALHPLLANLQPAGAHMPCYHSAPHYPNIFAQHSTGSSSFEGMACGNSAAGTQDLQSSLGRKLGQANYLLAELSLTRLSIKLHGVTPEALPGDLRAALMEWLANTDVRLLQGFIRPGCVHLSLDCLQVTKSKGTAAADVATSAASSSASGGHMHGHGCTPESSTPSTLDHLLQYGLGGAHAAASLPCPLAGLFSSCTIVELQSPNKLVLMEGEAVWSTTQLDRRPNLPTIHSVQPMVLLAGSTVPQVLNIAGQHLEGSKSTAAAAGPHILVRSSGRFVPTTNQRAAAGSFTGLQQPPQLQENTWRVTVDSAQLQPGLAVVECQNGRLLSNWLPVLVVDDIGVQQELLQLQPLQFVLPERVGFLTTGLALLLQVRSMHTTRQQQQQHMAACTTRNLQTLEQVGATSDTDDVLTDGGDSDDDALTAPSVSEADEDYMYDTDDEAMEGSADDDIVVMDDTYSIGGHNEQPMRQLFHHSLRSAPMRMARVPSQASRLMSWDSDMFGDAMVHSSWGSNMTTSLLVGTGHAEPVRDVEMGGTTRSGDSTQYQQLPSRFGAGAPGMQQTNAPAQPCSLRPAAHAQASLPGADPSPVLTPEVCAGLVRKALKLLAFACDAGWPCTTRLLLDTLTTLPLVPTLNTATSAPGRSLVPMTTQAVLSSTIGPDAFTPLHRAARSGSAATVRELLSAAASAGLQVKPAARGGAAVSPLHCAGQAAAEAGPAAALLLLYSCPEAALQWFVARSADGRTPAQLCAHPAVQSCGFQMVQALANQ